MYVLVVLPSSGCMVKHIIPTLSLKHVARIYRNILWCKMGGHNLMNNDDDYFD